MKSFEEEQNYLRENRFECADCHTFGWGHEMERGEDGKFYHPDHLPKAVKKASVTRLDVPKKETPPAVPEEERLAA